MSRSICFKVGRYIISISFALVTAACVANSPEEFTIRGVIPMESELVFNK